MWNMIKGAARPIDSFQVSNLTITGAILSLCVLFKNFVNVKLYLENSVMLQLKKV